MYGLTTMSIEEEKKEQLIWFANFGTTSQALLRIALDFADDPAPQRKWLDRIGQQLKKETIVDREALDTGSLKPKGVVSNV
ncbi:type III restriction enzyme res subunit (plasmid) [Calothrix sp. NIES-4071]|nr:type III restriction enzyme res subunit [Calothrix sp. NIES-4071]BAZ64666.1 type III restriction enzyme res subunit [Calothrix sp. NIES-4105]